MRPQLAFLFGPEVIALSMCIIFVPELLPSASASVAQAPIADIGNGQSPNGLLGCEELRPRLNLSQYDGVIINSSCTELPTAGSSAARSWRFSQLMAAVMEARTAADLVADICREPFAIKNRLLPRTVRAIWEQVGKFTAQMILSQKVAARQRSGAARRKNSLPGSTKSDRTHGLQGVALPGLGTFSIGPVLSDKFASHKRWRPVFALVEGKFSCVQQERPRDRIAGAGSLSWSLHAACRPVQATLPCHQEPACDPCALLAPSCRQGARRAAQLLCDRQGRRRAQGAGPAGGVRHVLQARRAPDVGAGDQGAAIRAAPGRHLRRRQQPMLLCAHARLLSCCCWRRWSCRTRARCRRPPTGGWSLSSSRRCSTSWTSSARCA